MILASVSSTGVPATPMLYVAQIPACSSALIGGCHLGLHCGQDLGIDDDLFLLRGILGPLVHELDIGLVLVYVVDAVVPVVALVNDHFDCGRFDPLVIDLHALVILLDRDGAAGPDVDLVALILDLALIIVLLI